MSAKNLLFEHCTNMMKSKEFKKEIGELFKPLFDYFFKELGIYLYFFIFFILIELFPKSLSSISMKFC